MILRQFLCIVNFRIDNFNNEITGQELTLENKKKYYNKKELEKFNKYLRHYVVDANIYFLI